MHQWHPGWSATYKQAYEPPWEVEYYSNRHLSGNPSLTVREGSEDIWRNWGADSPDVDQIHTDDFSARWTRIIRFPNSGTYRFFAQADDGVRVWLDDIKEPIIDQWHEHLVDLETEHPYCSKDDYYLHKGEHSLEITYFEHLGGAMLQFWREQVEPGEPPCPTDQRAL